MTVADLIERLQSLPQHLPVRVRHDDDRVCVLSQDAAVIYEGPYVAIESRGVVKDLIPARRRYRR